MLKRLIVPGSTLNRGQIFAGQLYKPIDLSNNPMEAVAIPFPKEESTPPTTKIYFAIYPLYKN
jgi:hypothetical protein